MQLVGEPQRRGAEQSESDVEQHALRGSTHENLESSKANSWCWKSGDYPFGERDWRGTPGVYVLVLDLGGGYSECLP